MKTYLARSSVPSWQVIVCTCVIMAIAACSNLTPRDQTNFKVQSDDYFMIAREAIKQLERTRGIRVIAVPNGLNPDALAALKAQRKVVARASLPATSFARDVLAMHDFTIDDEGIAIFEGEISTDAQDALGDKSDCGMIFAVRFQLVGNDWHSDSYKLTDCTQQRVWWPADQPQPAKPSPSQKQ